jgi:hypothetical protein
MVVYALPFSCKPVPESAPRFYTMSLQWDCLQRLYGFDSRRPTEVTGSVRAQNGHKEEDPFRLCLQADPSHPRGTTADEQP